MAFTFNKSERLCNKTIIQELFEKGNRAFTQFPFRFSWVSVKQEGTSAIQVLFTVPKRNFQRAHQRNQIKRQLREAYRLNKHVLSAATGKPDSGFAVMIAYIAKEKMTHHELVPAFRKCLIRLHSELEKTNTGALPVAD